MNRQDTLITCMQTENFDWNALAVGHRTDVHTGMPAPSMVSTAPNSAVAPSPLVYDRSLTCELCDLFPMTRADGLAA